MLKNYFVENNIKKPFSTADDVTEAFKIPYFNEMQSSNLGKVYIAESCFEGGEIQSKFRFIQQEQFNIEEFSGSCYFVGAGCSLFPEVNNLLPGAYPSAENLLMIARKKLNKNELVKPEEILPIYLNDENSSKKLKGHFSKLFCLQLFKD